MEIFPVAQLRPKTWHWDIAGTPLTGGAPVAGAPQTADASCGGWWTCDLGLAMMTSRADHKTWRGIAGRLKTAAGRMSVPMIDACQPWPGGVIGPGASRFFTAGLDDDDFIFPSDTIHIELAADAYMPAWPAPPVAPTVAQLHRIVGAPIEAGMYFSVRGDSNLSHLHLINSVVSVDGDVYTVSVSPPFREDYASGLRCEFDSPFCAMKLDIASLGNVMPQYGAGFIAAPSLRFVETFI